MGRHEAGAMLFVFGFPNYQNLIYRDVTRFVVTVLEMKHSFFNLQNFAAQA